MHRAWRRTTNNTIAAVGRAMGMISQEPPPSPVISARPGETLGIDGTVEIHTEDGGVVRVAGRLPPDLPFGYHDLVRPGSDSAMRLIVAPRRCFLPTDFFGWGWAIQLYALRSRSSWGIGDLGDLRRLNEWSARIGADAVLINPLHSVDPETHRASPYFPSSRLFRNPLYLRIEEIDGAAAAALDLDELASAGRALNGVRRIDRAAVHRLKMDALELLWRRFGGDAAFDRYRAEVGIPLRDYATFVALAEQFGSDWRRWPAQLRHPCSGAVVRAARDLGHRVMFHEWVQWCLDRQFESACASVRVTNDLAVGVDPAGADAWLWQDFLTPGVTIGAPPDDFNLSGQDWGVLPLHPWRLRSGCYEPFIHTVRASLRHAGGLRYDHVMGLFRLFWIPLGSGPADGAYVRYPSADLLDILALESHRAGAYVVGEDLGTVEAGVRERLADRNVLSYRLMVFEVDAPSRYPQLSVACVSNHDLPTLAGLWSGSDLSDQVSAGVTPNRGFATDARQRLTAVAGVDPSAPTGDAVVAVYRALADAPSMILTATLDDALGVKERPNIPGTGPERANWSLALPYLLDEIERHPAPRALGRLLARRP